MLGAADMFDYGFEACGRLFQYNVFWDVGFATKDPNIVKVCVDRLTSLRPRV